MIHRRFVSFCLAVLLLAATAVAGNWPQFRGEGGNGRSDETGLPTEWAADKNVAWKVAIPGAGWSGPVVWGDKVFVTSAVADQTARPRPFRLEDAAPGGKATGDSLQPGNCRWQLLCLDRATGKILWERTAAEGKPTQPIHVTNTYAAETPATDGERVYAYFGTVGVFCYDMAGNRLWAKDLGSYKMGGDFGAGSSPVVAGGKLFVQYDNKEHSFLVALDAKSGRELWRAERKERSSWSTPFIWRAGGKVQVVACGPGGNDEDDDGRVRAYDAATGEVVWELRRVSGGFTASPASDGERLYVGACGTFSNGPIYAIKPEARGDITPKSGESSSAGVAWLRPSSNIGRASLLVYDGYLYVAGTRNLSCYDARTGEPKYVKERLTGARNLMASPWAYGGFVFCLDEGGETFVVRAGPAFKVVGRNKLDEMCWACPAVSGGSLFVRGVENLYRLKTQF
jgi:outer membrane protein assembly factor BamB